MENTNKSEGQPVKMVNNGFWFIYILSMIAIALATGGGVNWWQNKKTTQGAQVQVIPTIKPTETEKNTPTPAPTQEVKVSKKSYSNLNASFSFPDSFNIEKPLSPIVKTGFVNQAFSSQNSSMRLLFTSNYNSLNKSIRELVGSINGIEFLTVNNKEVAILKGEQNSWVNWLNGKYQVGLNLFYNNQNRDEAMKIFEDIVASLSFK